MKKSKTRLYINKKISPNLMIYIKEKQHHFLKNVLRIKIQDKISVFDGKMPEYLGSNKTSSKVNASFIVCIYTYIQLLKFIKSLKFHNVNKFLLTLFD